MTWTIDEILEEATPPETVVSLCIRGDLVAQYEALEAEFAAAPPPGSYDATSLGDVPERVLIAQRLEQLRVEMLDKQVTFRFRAIDPKKWSDLFAVKPEFPAPNAETGDPEVDAAAGKANAEARKAFTAELYDWFTGIIVASCYEPVMTARKAEALAKKLSTAQWGLLQDAAWEINTERQAIPFSAAASALLLRTTAR